MLLLTSVLVIDIMGCPFHPNDALCVGHITPNIKARVTFGILCCAAQALIYETYIHHIISG